MTKQKTAMQEMRELIESLCNRPGMDSLKGITFEYFLDKEREQIIAAYEKGDKYKFEISGEQMFTETYEQ